MRTTCLWSITAVLQQRNTGKWRLRYNYCHRVCKSLRHSGRLCGNAYICDAGNNSVKYFKPTGGYFVNAQLHLIFDGTTVSSAGPCIASAAKNYTVYGYNTVSNPGLAVVNIQAAINPLPIISYSSPQTYVPGSAITPLTPTSEYVSTLGYAGIPLSFGSALMVPQVWQRMHRAMFM